MMVGVYMKTDGKLILVLSPYTPYKVSDDKKRNEIINDRVKKVSEYVARLLKNGDYAFSLIGNFHHLVRDYSVPQEYAFWERYSEKFLSLQPDEAHVLMLPGWKESEGVQDEIFKCRKHGVPVKYKYY